MRTFSTGTARVWTLAYSPDSRFLVVDSREVETGHPWMGFNYFPAWELVWWDWTAGVAHRRFRLRDSLYGPGGSQTGSSDRGDWNPEGRAFDVSFSFSPWRIVAAWEWTNKEDGVCAYDVDNQKTINLWVPYKTHTQRLALSPDGNSVAAATVNNMDGSALFEVWDLQPAPAEASPSDASDRNPNSWSWEAMIRQRLQEAEQGCWNCLGPLSALTFNGRYVAAACGNRTSIQLWDSQAPPPAARDQDEDEHDPMMDFRPSSGQLTEIGFIPRSLAFAPGAAILAVGGDGLGIHDPATNRWTPFTRVRAPANTVGFSADNRQLVVGTEAGTVELWDVEARRLVIEFDWGCGPISAVALAPDAFTGAAGTTSGTVVVWDSET